MKKDVKKLNRFFKTSTKKSIDSLMENLVLSERQEVIFKMFYIKKYSIDYIADTLHVCSRVVGKELSGIRDKIYLILD